MSRYLLCGVMLAVFAAPAFAETPAAAEQTKNGTIIWKAPRPGEAPAIAPPPSDKAAPSKDTIIWNDDPKAAASRAPAPRAPALSAGVPDRNGIIWNDPPGAAAKAAPPPPPPAAVPPQSASAEAGPCREYDTEITVEGRRQAMRGTACRQPDGRWRVISQVPR